MPRYGPGQSGPPPRARARPPAVPATPRPRTTRADIKATTTVKPAPRKTAAQGGAVLRRGTFQPENRKQQAELAAGVRQNAAEQQRQQRQQRLKVAYGRLSVRREQARQRGDAAGIARYDKHLTAMEPHLEAAGLTPKPSKFLDSAYGAVQRAEKIPVAGELLGMVDPILAAKTAISNAKALPDIGTKKFGKGQINAGVVFGKGGEFAKGGEEAGGLKPAGAKAPDLGPDPPGTLYHGSPEGHVTELDPLRHTRAWREGIGFYLTENAKKAEGYARGRTARGDRRTTAATSGKVSGFRLKPGAKVLDMGKPADLSLWRSIAKDHGFSEADFNHYIARQAGEHPTNNRIREELLYQLHDTHGTDAPYELEQAITQRGYHATTHMEGPNRVWVIKDKNAVERVATQSERVAEAMAARKLAIPEQRPKELTPQTRVKAHKRLAEIDAANAKIFKAFLAGEEVAGARALQAGRNMTKRGRRGPTVTQQREQYAQHKLSAFLEKHADLPVVQAYLKREAEGNRLRDQLNAPEDYFAHKPEEGLDEFLRQAKAAEPHLRKQTEELAGAVGARFEHGPTKTAARTLEKANTDYGGNLAKVKDAARSKIIVDTPEQAKAILEQAKASGNLVGVKDRFRLTGRTGYGDLKLYLKHGDHVTELQVVPREVHEAHQRLRPLYMQRRALPPTREAEAEVLAKKMHAGYAEAFRAFERRSSNSLRSIGTPSESANSRLTRRGGSVSQASIPEVASHESGIPSASKKVGRAGTSGAAKELPSGVAPASSIRPRVSPVVPQEDVAAAKVRASLGPARARRAAQEGLYREERGKRIGRAQSASERAGGGEAGFAAAKAELRGALPKVQFKHLREGNLSQGEFENLLTQVQNHPGLRWYDKIHAQQGLADAFREGKTPQKSQIKHLQTVFGDDIAKEIVKASKRVKVGRGAMKVLNMPRELMASFDLSAPFRQGLVAGVSHPGIFFKNFVPMVKAAGSDNYYRAMMDNIEHRPNTDLYHESGLKLTDMNHEAGLREEQFPESYAEKLNVPVGKGHSVGPGHVVRASGRAYTGFLNKMRADMFDHLLEVARKKGENVEDRKFQRALSSYINSATGRGSLGPAEHLGPALNTFFFSPRLMASRINFMDPTWYMRKSGVGESPFVRKQALKSAGKLAAFGSGVGLAGAAAGGKIGYDPRSSDFGKVKFGNTRLDPLGGFSQYAVAASRIASGKSISSTTGQVSKLGPGLAQLSRKDIAERFFAGKATPTVAFVYDLLQSKTFQGQPLTIQNEVLTKIIPLAIQDAYSLEQDTKNIPLGAAGYVASGLGIGLQTYGPKQLKPNTGKFHQKRQEYLDAAKKAGLLPKDANQQPPAVRKAFALRELREIAYAKAGGHTLSQHQRFTIDQQLLLKRKAITPAQAKTGEAWAKKASDKEIAGFRRELGDRYFGTATLKGATQQINAHGGNVSLR